MKTGTETPLNARQWLNNWAEPDWAPAPGFDWPAAAKMCEAYARAVLAEAERALRKRLDKGMLEAVAEDGLLVSWDKDHRFNFTRVVRLMAEFAAREISEAADLLAGMRR